MMTAKQKYCGFIAWFLAALFFLYEFFLRTFPGSITLPLISGYHLSPTNIAMLGSAYYATYAIMQIPIGYLIGRFGVKKIVAASLFLCLSGNCFFVFAHSFTEFFTARILMGLGSAAAFSSMLMVAKQWFSKKRYGFFAGTTQIIGDIGPLLAGAPFLFAVKQAHNDWRIPLIYVAIFGLTLLIAVMLLMKDKNIVQHDGSISRLNNRKFINTPTNIISQIRILLGNKQVRLIATFAFISYASIPLFGAVWGVLYLQSTGISNIKAAGIISSLWVGLAIGSPLIGWISDVLCKRAPMLAFCAILGTLVSFTIIYIPISNIDYLFALFFLLGFSGASQTLSFVLLRDIVDEKLYPCALGLNNSAVMLGGIIVPLIVGLGFNFIHLFVSTSKLYSPETFKITLTISPLLFVLSYIYALFLIPKKRKIEKAIFINEQECICK